MERPTSIFGPVATANGAFFRLFFEHSDQPDEVLSPRFIQYILHKTLCNACRQPVSDFSLHSPERCTIVPRSLDNEVVPDQLEYFIPLDLVQEFRSELRRDNLRRYKKYRAFLVRESGGQISLVEKSQLMALQQNRCYYCFKEFDNERLTDKPHLDHYVSVSSGGHGNVKNLVYACGSCNSRKGARDGLSFRLRKLKSVAPELKADLVKMRRDVKKWKES